MCGEPFCILSHSWSLEERELDDEIRNYIEHHREIHLLDKEQLREQAAEYRRRLDELNHAHARAQEDKAQFVNIDLYNNAIRELTDNYNKYRQILEETRNIAASNSKDIQNMQANILWISRTIFGTLIGAAALGLASLVVRGVRGG